MGERVSLGFHPQATLEPPDPGLAVSVQCCSGGLVWADAFLPLPSPQIIHGCGFAICSVEPKTHSILKIILKWLLRNKLNFWFKRSVCSVE